MNKRIDVINNSNASVFISVHLNKFNISKYSGAQVFYSLSNSNNYILANEIQYSLKKILGNTDRVIKGKNSNYILNRVNVPYQYFTNRADLRGGGTLGNISSKHVSMICVDIGLPQLAMHSFNETAGVKDVEYAMRAFKEFYSVSIINENGNYIIK